MRYRGDKLDSELIATLNDMMADGYHISPISRTTVQKRLKLKSRSTLLLNGRAEKIDNARKEQLADAGLDENGKKKRRGLYEQNALLKARIAELEMQNNNLLEKYVLITNGIIAKGLDVEELMKPLFPKYLK